MRSQSVVAAVAFCTLACGGAGPTLDAPADGGHPASADAGRDSAGPDAGAGNDAARDASSVAPAQQVVFMMTGGSPAGDVTSEIGLVNLDGTGLQQLTSDGTFKFLPHFSPDATKLLYTNYLKGHYGDPSSVTDVFVHDFATGTETNLTKTGKDSYGVWSPDGKRIAFLETAQYGEGLWVVGADGSGRRHILDPVGPPDELTFGDIAWSSDDWILFAVAQDTAGCFKVRLDKIRPDGSARTRVTDGGPNCTPSGMEQSGDADPGFSSDGRTIYSSRGFPVAPAGAPQTDAGTGPSLTERKLYAFSSDAWSSGKPEQDLSLPSEPSCIEGVPKGSPDGTRVLLFRLCFDRPGFRGGVYLADTSGSYRTFVVAGFGPDWNPVARP